MNKKIEKMIQDLYDNKIEMPSRDGIINQLYYNGIIHENVSILIRKNNFVKEEVYDDFVNESFLKICSVKEKYLIKLYNKDIRQFVKFVCKMVIYCFYINKKRKPNTLGEKYYFSKYNKKYNYNDDRELIEK